MGMIKFCGHGLQRIGLSIVVGLSLAAVPQAMAISHLEKKIVLVGRSNSIVTKSTIQVGDIADITASDPRDDEAAIAISRIDLQPSPAPGQAITIAGNEIVARIRAAGVDIESIRYTIPRSVAVERAGRVIGRAELEDEFRRLLAQNGREVVVREVTLNGAPQIAPGPVRYEIESYPSVTPGRELFSVRAIQQDFAPVSFQAEALVDEWREVAIARRPIARGSVVGSDDVALARLKTSTLPRDRSAAPPEIVGLAAAADIAAGEVFRASKLSIPTVIAAGARVTLLYRSKLMEATAQGTALENAGMGAAIRVRNDGSRKVIVGRVLESGLVTVSP